MRTQGQKRSRLASTWWRRISFGLSLLVPLAGCMRIADRPGTTLQDSPAFRAARQGAAHPAPDRGQIAAAYGKLPLYFEVNQGQTDGQVQFLARGSGYTVFLTATEAVLALRQPHEKPSAASPQLSARTEQQEQSGSTVLRMQLVNSSSNPHVTGAEELPGKVSYFRGTDPTRWRTHIPTYARVHYQDVYPGVDLVYYGNQGQLECDFVVAPGADPAVIRLAVEGADTLDTDAQGDLHLRLAGGEVRLPKPRVYQEVDGVRHEIPGGFVLLEAGDRGSPFRNPQSAIQLWASRWPPTTLASPSSLIRC